MKDHKYSVLMTVYKNDNAGFFKASIMSMINQTKKPDEIVIVKDGPIPQSLQSVIDEVTSNSVEIVELQLENNVGLGLALNEGIKIVRNELIARMDADDISLPNRCEVQIEEFMKDASLDIVGSSVLEFEGSVDNIMGKRSVPITNEEIYKYCKRRDPFNHPVVMYRKSKLEQVGGYGNYRKNQDTDLWIKLLHAGCKAKNIDQSLLYFRFDKNTYKKRKNWLNTKLLIKIRYNAYKMGFCSIVDFLTVAFAQLAIFIMPICFQRFIYQKVLRKKENE